VAGGLGCSSHRCGTEFGQLPQRSETPFPHSTSSDTAQSCNRASGNGSFQSLSGATSTTNDNVCAREQRSIYNRHSGVGSYHEMGTSRPNHSVSWFVVVAPTRQCNERVANEHQRPPTPIGRVDYEYHAVNLQAQRPDHVAFRITQYVGPNLWEFGVPASAERGALNVLWRQGKRQYPSGLEPYSAVVVARRNWRCSLSWVS